MMHSFNNQYFVLPCLLVLISMCNCASSTLNSNILLKKALKDGVNINKKLSDGKTLLSFLVKQNDIDGVKLILENGGNPNEKDSSKDTALSLAVNQNDYKLVKLLLEFGANPNIKITDSGLTVLFETDNIKIIELLLQYRANLNARRNDGTSLLKEFNNPKLIKLFLESNGNVNIIERNGTTKLMRAAILNDIKTATSILKTVKDKNIIDRKDSDGWTALMLASFYGHKEFVKLLKNNGTNVNTANNVKKTSLMFAVLEKHYEIIKLLVQAGANVNAKDNAEWTPLWYTMKKNSKFNNTSRKIIDLLLKHGAGINSKDFKGYPLLLSSLKFPEYAEYLCNKGANVNGKDRIGNTALIEAARLGKYDMISLLLKNNALVNLQNNDNLTALDMAILNLDSHQSSSFRYILEANLIVQLLRKHKAKTAKELREFRVIFTGH